MTYRNENYKRIRKGVHEGRPYRVSFNRTCDEGKGDSTRWRWFLYAGGKYIGDFRLRREALRNIPKPHRTVTITRSQKYRFASDFDCDVSEIDKLIASGVLDTPGIEFREEVA